MCVCVCVWLCTRVRWHVGHVCVVVCARAHAKLAEAWPKARAGLGVGVKVCVKVGLTGQGRGSKVLVAGRVEKGMEGQREV